MSVENDVGFWKWALGAVVAGVGGFFGYHKYLDSRFGKKADKDETARCVRHIEKLYENAEADRKMTRDLHDKAMEGVRDGQRQIIEILTRR